MIALERKGCWVYQIGFILGGLFLLGSGCSQGLKANREGPSTRLSGDSLQKVSSVRIVPISFEEQRRSGTIQGLLLRGGDLITRPLGDQPLVLVDAEGKEVSRTRTDSAGRFQFKGHFPLGNYSIHLKAHCFKAEQSVEVTQQRTQGVIVRAFRDPSCIQ